MEKCMIVERKLSKVDMSKFKELNVHGGQLVQEMMTMEEGLLLEVLTNYLSRAPEKEDMMRCERRFVMGELGSYKLSYDELEIGTVKYNIAPLVFDDTFTPPNITFTPK